MLYFKTQTSPRPVGRHAILPCLCLLILAGCSRPAPAQSQSRLATKQAAVDSSVPNNWHVSNTEIGKLKMAFPGKPSIEKMKFAKFPAEVHEFSQQGKRFVLQIMDISADRRSPRSIESLKALAERFDDGRFETTKSSEVKWLDRTVIEVSFQASDESDDLAGVLRTFYHEDLVITIWKMAPQGGQDFQQETDTFFASLCLDGSAAVNANSTPGPETGMNVAPAILANARGESADANTEANTVKMAGQKPTKDVIQKLLKANSDVDFLMASDDVAWEKADPAIVSFVIDLWLTAEDMSALVMRSNASADASISVLGLHDALSDHSVNSWFRRRKIRSFFAQYYGEQVEILREVVGLEARTKHLVSKLGGNAAPSLASIGRWEMIEQIGNSSVAPLIRSAENEKSPHRLAAYFMLKDRFPEATVTPLPVEKLLPMARRKSNKFNESAIKELVRRGHASQVIEEVFGKNPMVQASFEYDADHVEQCQIGLKKVQEILKNWPVDKPSLEQWHKASYLMDKGTLHRDLFRFYSQQNKNTKADKEFSFAVAAFEAADKLLHIDVKDERDMNRIRDIRRFNLNNYGQLFQAGQLHEKAIEKFRQALAVDKLYVDAAEGIAISMMQTKQYQAAADQFQHAAEIKVKGYDPRYHNYEQHYQARIKLMRKQIEALRMLGKTDEIKRIESNIISYLVRL